MEQAFADSVVEASLVVSFKRLLDSLSRGCHNLPSSECTSLDLVPVAADLTTIIKNLDKKIFFFISINIFSKYVYK